MELEKDRLARGYRRYSLYNSVEENAEFKEDEHPRGDDGKFGTGGKGKTDDKKPTKSKKEIKVYKKKKETETKPTLEKARKDSDEAKGKFDSFVSKLKEKYGKGFDDDFNFLYMKNRTDEEKKQHDDLEKSWQEKAKVSGEMEQEELDKKRDIESKKTTDENKKEKDFEKGKKEYDKKKPSLLISKYDTKIVDDAVKSVKKFKQKSFVALRGDDISVKQGQVLDRSEDMREGGKGEKLEGTSAFMIDADSEEEDIRDQIRDFLDTYKYSNLSIVSGKGYEYGNDPGEVVIDDCKVLGTWGKE